MDRRRFLQVAAAAILLGPRAFAESIEARVFAATGARWYKVLIHSHCRDFSDGALSAAQVIKTAKKMGYAALIETDHYKSIFEKGGQTPRAFEKYRQAFSSQDGIIVIPAAEINTATAHILALGDILYDEELLRLYGQSNAQQAVLDRLTELGLISVAAHPSLREAMNPKSPGNYTDMTFDWENARGLGGVEMLNDGEFYAETVQHYVNGVLRGEKWSVTAGCDQHGVVNPALDKRWTRATWVWVEGEFTKQSLLAALRQGRTYAAQYGVRLAEVNHIPARGPQVVDRPVISFRLEFGRPLQQPKKVRLCRDGAVALESVCSAGQSSASYSFDDKMASRGQHAYILEVEGVLITSSINLEVREDRLDSPEITPSLLGKLIPGLIVVLDQSEIDLDHDGQKDLIVAYRFDRHGEKREAVSVFLAPGSRREIWDESFSQVGLGLGDPTRPRERILKVVPQSSGQTEISWSDHASGHIFDHRYAYVGGGGLKRLQQSAREIP